MSSQSICNLFYAAKMEYLQEQWDKELIRMWREPGHVNLGPVCDRFMARESLSVEAFMELRRVPPKYNWKYKVPRFIAAFLPRTSKRLFDGANDETVLRCLKDEDLLKRPCDSTGERRQIRLEISASLISSGISSRRIHNANHSKTNWKLVK